MERKLDNLRTGDWKVYNLSRFGQLTALRKMGRRKHFPAYSPIYKGKRPTSITIAGETFAVRTWRQVLLKTCEFVRKLDKFDSDKMLGLKGSQRQWFSRNPLDLRDPLKLEGTGLFVEANFNANGIVRTCFCILERFGIEPRITILTHRRE